MANYWTLTYHYVNEYEMCVIRFKQKYWQLLEKRIRIQKASMTGMDWLNSIVSFHNHYSLLPRVYSVAYWTVKLEQIVMRYSYMYRRSSIYIRIWKWFYWKYVNYIITEIVHFTMYSLRFTPWDQLKCR